MHVVAEHRDVALTPLAIVLDGMALTAQGKWTAWRKKQGLQESMPATFDELVNTCATFADPAITSTVTTQIWDGNGWIPRA